MKRQSSKAITKKHPRSRDNDAMRAEYDFSNGVRGKYAGRFPPDPAFVTFDPEMSALLFGSGTLQSRLRTIAASRRGDRAKPRMVTSIVITERDFRLLKPLLTRLGARTSVHNRAVAAKRFESMLQRLRRSRSARLARTPKT